MNKLGQSYKLAQVVNRVSGHRMVSTSPATLGVTKVERDNIHPGYFKIRAKMEQFQVDDGVPVHLKGGMKDHVLYYFTIGLCVLSLGMGLNFIRVSAFPPAKKD